MKLKNYNSMKNVLLILVAALFTVTNVYAQSATIGGSVIDAQTGETLPGAAIVVTGTSIGTSSDFDGNYILSNMSKGEISLTCSYMGYADMVVKVKIGSDGATIKKDFFLQPNSVKLDELIVIGYGVQKKTDKTGAVSQIKAADMNGGVLTDPVQAIQGKSAGVLVSKKGGDPNSGFAIKIRGSSGLDSDTQPLYVVDGIPGVDPTTIASEDIETFNILKDAASTAIYGSRGANGVVIITTKGASKAGFQVKNQTYNQLSFNAYVSLDQVSNKLDLLTADEIRQYVQDNNLSAGFVDGGDNTDWQDAIFRTGVSQNYNLNASGSNEKSSYYASVTHSDWEGVVIGSEKVRTIGRVNFTHKAINDRLLLSGTLSETIEENDYVDYSDWSNKNILYTAYTHNPTDPIYNDDGTFNQTNRGFKYCNPVSTVDEVTNHRSAKRFLGSLKADLNLFEGFILSGSYSYTRDDSQSKYYIPKNGLFESTTGENTMSYSNNYQNILELTANYNKTFNKKHNFGAVLGYSYQDYNYDGFSVKAENAQSAISEYNLSAFTLTSINNISSYKGDWTLIGFFGRAQYNFNERYFASASLRRDGSSKFGANNKWGWFPTVAAGWNIDRESFMQDVDWLNQLKLRASYGVSGNQEIGEYKSLVAYNPSGVATNPETGEVVVVFSPAWNANPDLKWEETAEVNVGIDFAVLNSRLSGTLELYSKNTTDMLGSYSVPVPPNLASTTYANSGEMINRGVEFALQAYAVDKQNFKWRANFNIARNYQKIVSLGEFSSADGVRKDGYISGPGLIGNSNWVTAIMEGYEIGVFYVPELVLDNSGSPYLLDGQFVYKTSTGGYTTNIDQAQRYVAGSATPDLEIGFSNSFVVFKNWTIDVNLRAWIGNDVFNATRMLLDYNGNLPNLNALTDALEWAELGRTSGPAVCDYYIEDGSFLRLDYLAIGYNFDMSKLKGIESLRLYVASNNLLTITGYSGLDPETTIDGLSFGVDMYNVYPKTRTFTLGVNVTF